ncbi:MAG: thioesterase domain-containing protein [Flavobacteriaceae bacterium]
MTTPQDIRATILDHMGTKATGALLDRLEQVTKTGEDAVFGDLPDFDSLDAVELCLLLEETYDVPVDIADFARVATLDEFARSIAARIGGTAEQKADPQSDQLIVLQGGKADVTPLFLVHAGGGGILYYKNLVAGIHPDVPVYGFQMRGIDGKSEPPESIEEMADHYAGIILELQPAGPWRVAGYSGGGVIAYEVVRRLLAAEKGDVRLAMIDTLCPAIYQAKQSFLERLRNKRLWTLDGARRELRNTMRRIRERGTRQELREAHSSAEPTPAKLLELKMFNAYGAAQRRYRATPLSGSMLLVRGNIVDEHHFRAGRALAWERVLDGEIEVVELQADHGSIIKPPAVDRVAGELSRYFGLPAQA